MRRRLLASLAFSTLPTFCAYFAIGCDAKPSLDTETADASPPQLVSPHATISRTRSIGGLFAARRGLEKIDATEGGFHLAEPARAALTFELPMRADGATHVEVPALAGASSGTRFTVTPLEVAHVVGALDDRAIVYHHAAPATELVIFGSGAGFEELRILETSEAPSTFRWRVDRPAHLRLRARESRIELVDDTGLVRAGTAPLTAVDANGIEKTLVVTVEGDVATATLNTVGLAHPIVVDPSWSALPAMSTPRARPFAFVLADGRVVVGGGNSSAIDVYTPSTNTWSSPTNIPLASASDGTGFTYARGALLVDGTLLVVQPDGAAASRWNPTTNAWAATGAVAAGARCLLTKLGDGKVLTVAPASGASQLYNPAANAWTAAPVPTGPTEAGQLVTAKDGRALLLEDYTGVSFYGYTSGGAWTSLTSTSPKKNDPTMLTLADGRVMVTSSFWGAGLPLPHAVLWNPTTNTWSDTLGSGHARRAAALTQVGARVLAISGADMDKTIAYSDAELWDPTTNTWQLVLGLPEAHYHGAAVTLPDQSVLVVGGEEVLGTATAKAARFALLADGVSCAPPTPSSACNSGFCVNDHCCSVSSCAAGKVCGTAGKCGFVLGTACTAPAQCGSGTCVDGVCCDATCTGVCEACNQAPNGGTCTAIVGNPTKTGRPACTGAGSGTTCGGTCDGASRSACVFPSATTTCGAGTCAAGIETKSPVCDGAGSCTGTTAACGAYACGALACRTSCALDVDCAPGYYCGGDTCLAKVGLGTDCKATSGCGATLTCVDGVCCGESSCAAGSSCATAAAKGSCRKLEATTCSSDDECGSGSCTDGVCCKTRCDGQCEACDVPGKIGACTPISGKPHGSKRAACSEGAGSLCQALECDGAKDAKRCVAFVNKGDVACKAVHCDGETSVPTSYCDGAGNCQTPAATKCGRNACDAKQGTCKTSCATTDDCAAGFGCLEGVCAEVARCNADGTISTTPDGKTTGCAPYVCDVGGTCKRSCSAAADCQVGFVCDATTSACVPSNDGGASGGCTTTNPRSSGGFVVVLLGLALIANRFRR